MLRPHLSSLWTPQRPLRVPPSSFPARWWTRGASASGPRPPRSAFPAFLCGAVGLHPVSLAPSTDLNLEYRVSSFPVTSRAPGRVVGGIRNSLPTDCPDGSQSGQGISRAPRAPRAGPGPGHQGLDGGTFKRRGPCSPLQADAPLLSLLLPDPLRQRQRHPHPLQHHGRGRRPAPHGGLQHRLHVRPDVRHSAHGPGGASLLPREYLGPWAPTSGGTRAPACTGITHAAGISWGFSFGALRAGARVRTSHTVPGQHGLGPRWKDAWSRRSPGPRVLQELVSPVGEDPVAAGHTRALSAPPSSPALG